MVIKSNRLYLDFPREIINKILEKIMRDKDLTS
jgi:hypothetical protein